MPSTREPEDLVGFHGGPHGTRFEITNSPWGPIPMVHVPDDEIVLPEDAPIFRIESEDGDG